MSRPKTRCPHGRDRTHAGLGSGWCLAWREGQDYLAARAARVEAYRAAHPAPTTTPTEEPA